MSIIVEASTTISTAVRAVPALLRNSSIDVLTLADDDDDLDMVDSNRPSPVPPPSAAVVSEIDH